MVKADWDNSEYSMLSKIWKSDGSDPKKAFKYALFAMKFVHVWPRIELKDGTEAFEENRDDGLSGRCPPGTGSYIEDDGGVIMGGFVNIDGLHVWLTVGALVQLGYLNELTPPLDISEGHEGSAPKNDVSDVEARRGNDADDEDSDELDIGF